MEKDELIAKTTDFVKETLRGAEGGHDWFHIQRVYHNAKLIAGKEDADILIVELGALLHDIADAKFHNGDESIGPEIAGAFLRSQEVNEEIVAQVINIIEHVSFKNSLGKGSKKGVESMELRIVRDADRLDAIGAIGIARAFNYGGFKNRPLYDPDIAPVPDQDKESYKRSQAPTINHFYEKLLLLKDKMTTDTGRQLADKRHQFMEMYLEQFYHEWNGNR